MVARTEGGGVVALGEVLVDFVSQRPIDRLADAPGFTPRFGGSPANISVGAARFGARVAFLGGAGDDPWGRWLQATLRDEGVDTADFALLEGIATPHAFVAVSAHGEPSFWFCGDREACVVSAAAAVEEELGGRPGVFVFGSDTLIGERERAVTLRAQRLARENGWIVLYDPNLRPARWPNESMMRTIAADALADSSVVKTNSAEAMALTRTRDPEAAALAILAAGAARAVVTLGQEGALLVSRGGTPLLARAPRAEVVDATGAGDAVAAVLAAALAEAHDLDALDQALPLAVETAARVVGATGALAGLPEAGEARRSLAAALGRRSQDSGRTGERSR